MPLKATVRNLEEDRLHIKCSPHIFETLHYPFLLLKVPYSANVYHITDCSPHTDSDPQGKGINRTI